MCCVDLEVFVMSETLRKLGLIGIGVLAITEEKIRQTVDELIEKGEMNREEGKSLVQELLTEKKRQMQELGDTISEDVQSAIGRSRIASKDDIARLEETIAGLEKAVKELVEKEK
jgi:polyhydroxyalkanoate synthesis regulator phasin